MFFADLKPHSSAPRSTSYLTVRDNAIVRVELPDVAVTVMGYVPEGVPGSEGGGGPEEPPPPPQAERSISIANTPVEMRETRVFDPRRRATGMTITRKGRVEVNRQAATRGLAR